MKQMTAALAALKGAAISESDTAPPFTFKAGGAGFPAAAKRWKMEKSSCRLDEARMEHVTMWRDPATSLSVKMVAVEYSDYPAVEWTVYVRNEGATTSPLIEGLCGLDAAVQRGADGEFVLHHQLGSVISREDYRPIDTRLEPRSEKRIATSGGRSTDSNWPYFNIEWSGEGLMLAVGWPGQWAATFTRDESTSLALRAGQEHTRFRLLPGEQVRTPLIVVMSWQGERFDAQNMWRRWMLKHSMPRPHGRQIEPEISGCSSHETAEMQNANTDNQKMFIDRYLEEDLKLDYWWMDAGWYPNNGSWGNTGTWEVDRKRFPGGLRSITDHGRERGVKSIVWFEPERVTPGTWLFENHPEWLLGNGDNRLLNLGNPEALKWVIERTNSLIDSEGVDFYRQDYNIDPLGFWLAGDGPEREGITENHYVSGFLAWWDELLRRHPNMLIDTCASGGKRNDLETLRRSVPLWRSDYIEEPVGAQSHTYGLSLWVPFYGTGTNNWSTVSQDAYCLRSTFGPAWNCLWDVRRKDLDYATMRRMFAELREIAPLMLEDYYPLSAYSVQDDVWISWQFFRPSTGTGIVMAFRRGQSPYESASFRLRGLDADAKYTVADADRGRKRTKTGRELMEQGLTITMEHKPDSALIGIQRER